MIGCVLLCVMTATAQMPQLSPLQKQRDELQTAIVKDDLPRLAALIKSGMKLDFNFDDEAPRQRTSESPMTMAVNRNKAPVVRMLLDGGASASRLDGWGRPPVQQVKSVEVARMLVAAGADPNAPNHRGYTGLAEAVERGDLAAVDALVAAGARFDAPSKSPDVFTLAAERRKADLIPALLERGADPRRPPTQALAKLIDADDTERAVALIQRGADPNARNQYAPVLLVALFRKRWAIADALVEAGAELKLADPAGCAGGYGCWSIQAARFASFEPPMLKKLAARGLDLNANAADGHTALTSLIVEQVYAVRAVGPAGAVAGEIPAPDNVARVRNLLGAGADPNRKYGEKTPLMVAIQRGGAFADVVFDAGGRVEYALTIPKDPVAAQPSTVNRISGKTEQVYINYRGVTTGMTVGPLTWTVLHQRADLAVKMLARDRRLDASDRYLLYFAGFLGQWDVVLAALPFKPDVNAGDRADVTPLMMAAQDGRADAVRALLAAGAKVNVRSDRTWPPLTERNLKEEFGGAIAGHSPAPPRLVGGYTALRAAKERRHDEVVRILTEAGGRE